MLLITLLVLIANKYYNILSKEHFTTDNKICCLYAYYEKDNLYKQNFEYFLINGILNNVDYYIIINGKCTVKIPVRDNIKIYERENKGYDFGAYSHAIKQINKINKSYDYYFFLNTSVCGPYLKNSNTPWTYYFLKLFNKKNVKLVGTSINIFNYNKFSNYDLVKLYNKEPPFTHVQSMFFCMDNEYFNYLINKDFFNEDDLNNAPNISYIIAHKEFGLSQHALNNNWNINCILPKYKNIDYINLKNDINSTSNNGDAYYPGSYFGKTIDKYDVIFYKNNRF
jgi:hypothetical protein